MTDVFVTVDGTTLEILRVGTDLEKEKEKLVRDLWNTLRERKQDLKKFNKRRRIPKITDFNFITIKEAKPTRWMLTDGLDRPIFGWIETHKLDESN